MRKPPRNFVVEFKSGSRRPAKKPASIWGNVDLKAIALAVKEDASGQILQANAESANSAPQTREETLTKTIEPPKTVLPPQEEHMAEETAPVKSAENAPETATLIAEPARRRGRQAKPVAPKTAAGDEKATTTKAARKPRAAKSELAESAMVAAKPPRKTRTSKEAVAAVDTPAEHGMTDLLQLEEENQTLRKQLAEKLRAENADLRKRLGHS
jgi:hypothetical protein